MQHGFNGIMVHTHFIGVAWPEFYPQSMV
jgi:hypothetical protein